MEDEPLIRARGVAFSYRGGFLGRPVPALLGADLELPAGQVTALLGPNGSGKSTLLHCLLGLLRPRAGEIRLLGLPPGHPDALRRIGFLPERDPPWGRLTGRSVLGFSARLHGLDRRAGEARAGELLRDLGLAGAADRPARGYSRGMGRRLALGAALVHDPDLLILDEPTAGLDPLGSGRVLDLLEGLRRRGRTILLSSHQYQEVETLAQRATVLHRGRVAAAGPAAGILADPECWQFTAAALSAAGRREVEEAIRARGRLRRSGPALRGLDQVLRRVGREGGEEGE